MKKAPSNSQNDLFFMSCKAINSFVRGIEKYHWHYLLFAENHFQLSCRISFTLPRSVWCTKFKYVHAQWYLSSPVEEKIFSKQCYEFRSCTKALSKTLNISHETTLQNISGLDSLRSLSVHRIEKSISDISKSDSFCVALTKVSRTSSQQRRGE